MTVKFYTFKGINSKQKNLPDLINLLCFKMKIDPSQKKQA